MLSVTTLLKDGNAYLGKEVTCHGKLLVGKGSSLAENYDAWERQERILLKDNDLIEKRLATMRIPAYGGGWISYDVEATVTAVWNADNTLTNISRCKVYWDSQEFVVL